MSGRCYDLTESEWSILERLLPRKSRGVKRVDDQRVLNGIFWVLQSGGGGAPSYWRTRPMMPTPYVN